MLGESLPSVSAPCPPTLLCLDVVGRAFARVPNDLLWTHTFLWSPVSMSTCRTQTTCNKQNITKVMDVISMIKLQRSSDSHLLTFSSAGTLSKLLDPLLALLSVSLPSWNQLMVVKSRQGTETSPTTHMEINLANRHVSDLGSKSFPVKPWDDGHHINPVKLDSWSTGSVK